MPKSGSCFVIVFFFYLVACATAPKVVQTQAAPPQTPVPASPPLEELEPSPTIHRRCTGRTVKDKREGIWTCINSKGIRVSEMTFTKGKKDGFARTWEEDGTIDTESFWKDGWLDGRVTVYRDGKRSSEAHYKKGRLDGQSVQWSSKGEVIHQSFYVDGQLEGVYLDWWENTQLRRRAYFKGGRQLGSWEFFDQEGRPVVGEEKPGS